ncbi:MAG: phage holin family protein, partial [Janthinobacterium lividum]
TLGLFLLVINALMLLLTSWLATKVGVGWYVDGFWTALLGSIVVSVVSFVLNAFLPERDQPRRGRA